MDHGEHSLFTRRQLLQPAAVGTALSALASLPALAADHEPIRSSDGDAVPPKKSTILTVGQRSGADVVIPDPTNADTTTTALQAALDSSSTLELLLLNDNPDADGHTTYLIRQLLLRDVTYKSIKGQDGVVLKQGDHTDGSDGTSGHMFVNRNNLGARESFGTLIFDNLIFDRNYHNQQEADVNFSVVYLTSGADGVVYGVQPGEITYHYVEVINCRFINVGWRRTRGGNGPNQGAFFVNNCNTAKFTGIIKGDITDGVIVTARCNDVLFDYVEGLRGRCEVFAIFFCKRVNGRDVYATDHGFSIKACEQVNINRVELRPTIFNVTHVVSNSEFGLDFWETQFDSRIENVLSVIWITGNNRNTEQLVGTYDASTQTIALQCPASSPIQVGDTLAVIGSGMMFGKNSGTPFIDGSNYMFNSLDIEHYPLSGATSGQIELQHQKGFIARRVRIKGGAGTGFSVNADSDGVCLGCVDIEDLAGTGVFSYSGIAIKGGTIKDVAASGGHASGIRLEGNDGSVMDGVVLENTNKGIRVGNSCDNIVSKCRIKQCNVGVETTGTSDYNMITSCNLRDTGEAVNLVGSSNCTANNILGP